MTLMTALLALPVAVGCGSKKDDGKGGTAAKTGEKPGTSGGTAKSGDPAKTPDKPDTPGDKPIVPAGDPVAAAGVEAGGIEHDKEEGAAAVLTAVDGTVEVRAVGKAEFTAAKKDTELYPGDVVRTSDNATATITLADETVIELAEVSTVGIASRDGSADPASGAAVLAGVARFSVSDRAPGEGAFKVYTPTGIVMTKGTVYVVGVAVTGEARVGVESGSVDVIGLGGLDAEPVAVEAEHAATFATDGSVGGSVEWTTDDWGTWRDEAEAEADAAAVVEVHAQALNDLQRELDAAYADMQASADAYADFEAKAAASADAKATADYEVIAPEGAATIEASFNLAGLIEALTWSYSAHAELAADVYARHPDEVKTQWVVVEPHADAAILWPKRFEVTSTAYLEPLRFQYYVHHPRGRAHAQFVGVAVPAFYANVEIPDPEPTVVRARVRSHIWIAPEVVVHASARPVWVSAPRPNWRAKVKVRAAAPRATVAWYVRPPQIRSHVRFGGEVKSRWVSRIVVKAPEPRAKLRVHWKAKADVGSRIRVKAPDLNAAAKARMNVKITAVGSGGGGIIIRDHRTGGADVRGKIEDHRDDVKIGSDVDVKVKVKDHRDDIKVGGDIKGDVGGDVKIKVKDHRDDAAKVGGDVNVKVKDHRDEVKGKVDAGAKVKVKVKAPAVKVKVKAPSVKVKGSASGGIKIGG
jgi:hypothetical protein